MVKFRGSRLTSIDHYIWWARSGPMSPLLFSYIQKVNSKSIPDHDEVVLITCTLLILWQTMVFLNSAGRNPQTSYHFPYDLRYRVSPSHARFAHFDYNITFSRLFSGLLIEKFVLLSKIPRSNSVRYRFQGVKESRKNFGIHHIVLEYKYAKPENHIHNILFAWNMIKKSGHICIHSNFATSTKIRAKQFQEHESISSCFSKANL